MPPPPPLFGLCFVMSRCKWSSQPKPAGLHEICLAHCCSLTSTCYNCHTDRLLSAFTQSCRTIQFVCSFLSFSLLLWDLQVAAAQWPLPISKCLRQKWRLLQATGSAASALQPIRTSLAQPVICAAMIETPDDTISPGLKSGSFAYHIMFLCLLAVYKLSYVA